VAEGGYESKFAVSHPHDLRRTAARNMERAAVPLSVAMALGGWRSESMYRRYAIASEADLRDGVTRLGQAKSVKAKQND
jgi:integrase